MSWNNKTGSAKVPTGRAHRLLRFSGMATGIAGRVAGAGLVALAGGQRPDLAQLLLTPQNTRALADGLSHLRGAALKLGQMISMDSGVVLPAELTAILASLRDDAQPMPPKQLQMVLNAEWGAGWRARFQRFDVRPFAAASIGQVHRAVGLDGTEMAIKVQYPGVRQSIDSDVDNMATLLRLPGLVPKDMDLAPLFAEAKRQLHAEADYLREAQYLAQFGRLLAGDTRFQVPRLITEFSTGQVLAMGYVAGVPIDDLRDAPQEQRNHVAAALIDLVLCELFVFGLMQTDPNLANYRYNPETGRIVLLDFGATQPIAPTLVAQFQALAGVALGGDAGQTRAALLGMGYMGPDTAAHHQALIQQMFDLATAPLRQEAVFDFGATDLLERLRDMGLAIGTERELAHVPPPETLFVHRKIGGMYLLATTLRAKLALRPMIAAHATGACTV